MPYANATKYRETKPLTIILGCVYRPQQPSNPPVSAKAEISENT